MAESKSESAAAAISNAEAAVDALGERVGQWVTRTGHKLLRVTARTREELEDIVAEAESLRRGPGDPKSA